MLRRVAGLHCVHYIEQKDFTARFATGGIYDRFPKRNLTGIVHLQRRDCTGMGPSMGTTSSMVHPPFQPVGHWDPERVTSISLKHTHKTVLNDKMPYYCKQQD